MCDEPYDAGLVVIDLVARLVVVDSTWSSPGQTGSVPYHNGRICTQSLLRYHLADDWRFLSNGREWRQVAAERRRERPAQLARDVRAVLQGRPLLEFVAQEAFTAFARRDRIAEAVRAQWAEKARKPRASEPGLSSEPGDASRSTSEEIAPQARPGAERSPDPFYDTLSGIHAAWLLTPRADLSGACPREVALDRHDHLVRDLQDRCDQWSRLGDCPPGLSASSHAFLHGGFGTHELIMDYNLVRELLRSCWGRLNEMAKSPNPGQRPDALTVGDFLAREIPRLKSVQETWLDTPDLKYHGRTPRSIIDRERARLPEVVSCQDAMIDPDCPCCQALSDQPGPVFWHLDGCNHDDEFAFDLHYRTRQEWEAERLLWEAYDRRLKAERTERQRLGVTDSRFHVADPHPVWSRSFSVGDSQVPLGVRVFSLGCQLAGLIVDLRGEARRGATPSEPQRQIDQLNRNFGNLREILQGADSSLAVALIAPVLHRFAEDLDSIATDRPDLALRCESLANDLPHFLDPPSEGEPAWDCDDPALPF